MTSPPHSAAGTAAQVDLLNDFGSWARLSAALLRRTVGDRARIIFDAGVAAQWSQADEHWSSVLMADIQRGDLRRPSYYTSLCREELEGRRRAGERWHSPSDELRAKAPARRQFGAPRPSAPGHATTPVAAPVSQPGMAPPGVPQALLALGQPTQPGARQARPTMTLPVHRAAAANEPATLALGAPEAPVVDAPPMRRESASLSAVASDIADCVTGGSEQDAETGKMAPSSANAKAKAAVEGDAETGKMARARAARDEHATEPPPASLPGAAIESEAQSDQPGVEQNDPPASTVDVEQAPVAVPRPGVPRPNTLGSPKLTSPHTQQLRKVQDPLTAPTSDLPASVIPALELEVPEDSAMDQVVIEGWTLKRYAWLCAELSHAPERVDEVWLVYGVREPGIRRTVMGAWNARLGQDDALRQRHATLIERFRGMLADT